MSIPITELSEPFDQIKQRKGNFGKQLDYVESSTVIQRLNKVLEGEWSFTVQGHQINQDEVIVRGQLEINGVVRQQFGGSQITRKTDSNEVISIADDLKAATADCLKKCASSFGVGLYLYSNGKISNKEITELFSTCKAKGVTQSQVIKTAKDDYNKSISQLTSNEASC
jgi:hypothetical protein